MNKQEFLNGRITLYNGDCFEFMQNMQEEVNLILTDPPYGLLNHKIETNIDIELFLNLCNKILKQNNFLIYFGQQPMITDWNYLANKLFNYKNEIIWYKRGVSCPFAEMVRVFENIMIYSKGAKKYNKITRNWSDILESLAEFFHFDSFKKQINLLENLCKENRIFELKEFLEEGKIYSKDRKSKGKIYDDKQVNSVEMRQYKRISDGYRLQNLLSFNEKNINGKIQHPTIKPLQLIEYLLLVCSNENDLIFDGFAGSGTTAVACIKTNRRFIGCELDTEYFDMACKRIESELVQENLFYNNR